jgi:hypothetical protein
VPASAWVRTNRPGVDLGRKGDAALGAPALPEAATFGGRRWTELSAECSWLRWLDDGGCGLACGLPRGLARTPSLGRGVDNPDISHCVQGARGRAKKVGCGGGNNEIDVSV